MVLTKHFVLIVGGNFDFMNIKKVLVVLIGMVSVTGIAVLGLNMAQNGKFSKEGPSVGYLAQKRIAEKKSFSGPALLGKYGPYEDVVSFDISENKLIIGYIKDGEYWVEVAGKKFGPFDDPNAIDFDGPEEDANFVHYNTYATNEAWAFSARRSGKWYVNANGKEYGPFDLEVTLEIQNGNIGFAYLEGQNIFFNINGKVLGPYGPYAEKNVLDNMRYYSHISLAGEGKWMFAYRNHEQCFVNVSGQDLGPFKCGTKDRWSDWVGDSHFSENLEHWSFFYNKEGKLYLKTDRSEYGPYDLRESSMEGFSVAMKDDRMIFSYFKSGQAYFLVDGKEYGPYEEIGGVSLTKLGWLAEYKRSGSFWLSLNGKEYGPFVDWTSGNVGDYHFVFEACNSYNPICSGYAIVDGTQYGPYSKVRAMAESGDDWGFSFEKNDAWYVNLNGKEFGPYYPKDPICPLNDFGNEIEVMDLHSGGGNAVLGFPYQSQDKKWNINVSGNDFGSYDAVGCAPFKGNKNQIALQYKNNGGWFVEVLNFKK